MVYANDDDSRKHGLRGSVQNPFRIRDKLMGTSRLSCFAMLKMAVANVSMWWDSSEFSPHLSSKPAFCFDRCGEGDLRIDHVSWSVPDLAGGSGSRLSRLLSVVKNCAGDRRIFRYWLLLSRTQSILHDIMDLEVQMVASSPAAWVLSACERHSGRRRSLEHDVLGF